MQKIYERSYRKYKNKNKIGNKIIDGEINITDIIKQIIFDEIVELSSKDKINFEQEESTNINREMETIQNIVKRTDYKILRVRKYGSPESINRENKYIQHRYCNVTPSTYMCNDNREMYVVHYNNCDDSIDFLKDMGYIFRNVNLSLLDNPKFIEKEFIANNDKLEKMDLITFNWSLTRKRYSKNFNLNFAMAKNSGIKEFGIKHTLLSIPDDLYMAGEGRIITIDAGDKKRYMQFNFNSSSFTFTDIISQYSHYNINKVFLLNFYYLLLDKILEKINDKNYVIEIVPELGKTSFVAPYTKIDLDLSYNNALLYNENKNLSMLECNIDDNFIKQAKQYKKQNDSNYVYKKIKFSMQDDLDVKT